MHLYFLFWTENESSYVSKCQNQRSPLVFAVCLQLICVNGSDAIVGPDTRPFGYSHIAHMAYSILCPYASVLAQFLHCCGSINQSYWVDSNSMSISDCWRDVLSRYNPQLIRDGLK